jgi:peptidyl-prolyl cis-trans isomerase B (cyclophilin B)
MAVRHTVSLSILTASLILTSGIAAAQTASTGSSTTPATKKTTTTKTATTAKKTTSGKTITNDAAIKSIDADIAAAKVDKQDPQWKTKLPEPNKATFVPKHSYYARMVTNKGTMLIKFRPDVAPMHVTSFIYLARLGFYDGLGFHRVIKGFMAQGGDPLGTGSGGPGYQFAGEFSPNVKHDEAGVLSTANAGPNTDGSQFFIMFKAYPSLDMHYSIFGKVVEGLETLKAMEAAGNPGDGPPLEPLTIQKVTIEVR